MKGKKKVALVTGITGQDGSYLAELLLEKGYEVHGLVRRIAYENEKNRYSRMPELLQKVSIHFGDIMDYSGMSRLLANVQPNEIYHLAAQSFVQTSFNDEFNTMHTNTEGTHVLLRAIVDLGLSSKFYFAATSEMFGQVLETPQNENTPFNPVSPYAISKLASYYLTRMYRTAYGVFACNGILFNHESPRRGLEFVTRKITHTAALIKLGKAKKLELGNPDAKRDWGFAGDYVEAMWLMLQQKKPDDYVVATGKTHSVREFVDLAFAHLDLDPKKYVLYNTKKDMRPAEVPVLLGDFSKARKVLGWKPRVSFSELVEMMVEADLKKVSE
ncbi:MAG: GDP-mannose 4,6-dehydratase [Patescibacteria group bacterium]